MISIDHIAIIASSEETLQFYEKLGFRESRRFERSYDTVVFMEHCGITLEIFIDSKHPRRITNPEAKGLRHIAFTVESLENVMEIVECEEIRTDWFGRRFTFCKDPDGQPIELKEKIDLTETTHRESVNWVSEIPVAGEMTLKKIPVAEGEWTEEYKRQFGTDPSFF